MPVTLVAVCSLIEPNREKYNQPPLQRIIGPCTYKKRVNLNLKSYGKIGMM